MTARASVLIVDDHPVFRRGLAATLAGEAWVGAVFEAEDVDSAVRVATVNAVSLVAMDLRLPDGDGLDATRRIVAAVRSVRVLILTMSDDETMVERGLRAGAAGYVLKRADPEDVVHALYTVWRGGTVLGRGVGTAALGDVRGGRRVLEPPFDGLAPRELEILLLLASGRTTTQVGRRLGIAEKTVRNQLSVIYSKLGVPGRVEAILLARQAGLGEH